MINGVPCIAINRLIALIKIAILFFGNDFARDFFKNSSRAIHIKLLRNEILRNEISMTFSEQILLNNSWLKSYKNFRNSLLMKNIDIKAKYIYNFKWHAKIFILKENDTPILGIIGSSNITRNAFSDDTPFNYEADVVLCPDSNSKISKVITTIAGTIKDELNEAYDPHEVVLTDYDPGKNHELSIEDRLNRLNEDIKSLNLRDLPE